MGVGAARPHSHSNCRLGFFLGFFMDYADFIAIIDGIDDPDNVGNSHSAKPRHPFHIVQQRGRYTSSTQASTP